MINSRGYLENGTEVEPSSSLYDSYYSSSTASSYENVLRDISVIINTRKADFTFPTQVDMLAIVANHSEPLLKEVMQQMKHYGKSKSERVRFSGETFWKLFWKFQYDANVPRVMTCAHLAERPPCRVYVHLVTDLD